METMNIALSEKMKAFVQEQVSRGAYSNASEYVCDLIRHEQQRKAEKALESMLIEGLDSGPLTEMKSDDWNTLRANLKNRYSK